MATLATQAELLTVTTRRAIRNLLLVLAASATIVASAAPSRAADGWPAQRRPVGFYDADAVLDAAARTTRESAAEELLASYEAEAAPLQREVDELRAQMTVARAASDAERRALETRLAHGTIALLVVRAEARRELAAVQERMRDELDGRIAAVASRVASAHDVSVVIRTDRFTRVLDDDAIDLTPQMVAALDRDAIDEPRGESPRDRRRTRLQSCSPDELAAGVD